MDFFTTLKTDTPSAWACCFLKSGHLVFQASAGLALLLALRPQAETNGSPLVVTLRSAV